VREKAACRCGGYIVTAPAPPKLIARGQYGPGFAAFLIVAKCADSIPIYRLEKRMKRIGIPLSRSTMNDVLHSAADVLAPLVKRLTVRMASVEIVLADETSMRLQDRDKRGFVWVFHGYDADSAGQLVLYVFALDRSSKTPKDVLGGTEGTLVVDGYTGYNVVEDPEQRKRAGCWCHGRRKFFEALSTAPEEAEHVITEMRELFRVEHEATVRGIVGTEEHLALRQDRSKPAVDKLFEWLTETRSKVLPKSAIGQAIGYMLNQRPRLELFLSDPRIPLHNNSSEERLRVVALGRKNFLFFGNPRAGRNFAGLYSLVGSCVANGVEPTAYLTDVITRVAEAQTDDELDALLPDRWTHAG
jgi:transposase